MFVLKSKYEAMKRRAESAEILLEGQWKAKQAEFVHRQFLQGVVGVVHSIAAAMRTKAAIRKAQRSR